MAGERALCAVHATARGNDLPAFEHLLMANNNVFWANPLQWQRRRLESNLRFEAEAQERTIGERADYGYACKLGSTPMKKHFLLSRRALLGGLGAAAGVFGAVHFWPRSETEQIAEKPAAHADTVNSFFDTPPADPLAAPALRVIAIPSFPGAAAIWAATGRDARGHIWFGVSAQGGKGASAHLFEYTPESGQVLDRGDVASELRRSGILRPGEGQMKIHSKIVQGEDGNLYFTSMDEEGEKTDGSRLPTWGGHLWRLRLPDYRWEHLLATPEALIAVAAAPRYIYALGYFDHVLYQYDCRTGATRSRRVGSVGGHISRNFLTDARGHVFVPRLREKPSAATGLATTLVEMDTRLQEVGETPIGHYIMTRDDDSHGITGVQPLADRSLVFTTDQGFLYRVRPRGEGRAAVEELDWFHPRGKTYFASLFTYDGVQHLMGLSFRQDRYEWVVFDLLIGLSETAPVALPSYEGQPVKQLSLYGSATRDNQGNFYMGGAHNRGPVLIQLARPK